jgi:hypothetical protein
MGNCDSKRSPKLLFVRSVILAVVMAWCYVTLRASASDVLVGTGNDPAFGMAQEPEMLADYGYDTARDIAQFLTLLVGGVVFIWPSDKTKEHTLKRLVSETLVRISIPVAFQLVCIFAINDFGSLGGRL